MEATIFLRPSGTHKKADICGSVKITGDFKVFAEVKTALKTMKVLEVE